jgi:16S rRNA (guanine966-N2)-methyltransferase
MGRAPKKKQTKTFDPRPIGARALKSTLDTLRPWLNGSEVLDLFAGEGRFGIAALGEKACNVTFVEINPKTASSLSQQVSAPDRFKIVCQDVFIFLEKTARSDQRFDIVFADPPFPFWNPEFSEKLYQSVSQVLNPGAIFLVKHPERVLPSLPSQGYSLWKSTRFGEATLIYFRYG